MHVHLHTHMHICLSSLAHLWQFEQSRPVTIIYRIKKLLYILYIHMHIYLHVCMYVCIPTQNGEKSNEVVI